ncbi:hypothetical protein [Neobacillus cucumis]|nr:hypothetical protein [Neobacillus cucumis]
MSFRVNSCDVGGQLAWKRQNRPHDSEAAEPSPCSFIDLDKAGL